MFALFFNLYYALFTGIWKPLSYAGIKNFLTGTLNKFGELITSLFNNVENPVTDVGDVLFTTLYIDSPNGIVDGYPYLGIIAFVLALITSIGIVVLAVKGVKRAFGIFFGQIR